MFLLLDSALGAGASCSITTITSTLSGVRCPRLHHSPWDVQLYLQPHQIRHQQRQPQVSHQGLYPKDSVCVGTQLWALLTLSKEMVVASTCPRDHYRDLLSGEGVAVVPVFLFALMTLVLCHCNVLSIHQPYLFLPDLLSPSSHSGRTASTISASGMPSSSATPATNSPTAPSWETLRTWS